MPSLNLEARGSAHQFIGETALSADQILEGISRIAAHINRDFTPEMDSDETLLGYGLPWRDRLRNLP